MGILTYKRKPMREVLAEVPATAPAAPLPKSEGEAFALKVQALRLCQNTIVRLQAELIEEQRRLLDHEQALLEAVKGLGIRWETVDKMVREE
jgi:hypothetical protein